MKPVYAVPVKDVMRVRDRLVRDIQKEMTHPTMTTDKKIVLEWVVDELLDRLYFDEVE